MCEFSPEQQKNIASIVWLYRGQSNRFLRLVESYLAEAVARGQAAKGPLAAFAVSLDKLIALIVPFATEKRDPDPFAETWKELIAAHALEKVDGEAFGEDADVQTAAWAKEKDCDNAALHKARKGLHPMAERCRDLTKQIDLAVKFLSRTIDMALKESDAKNSDLWANVEINKARKVLETARAEAVEALRKTR